MFDDDDDEEEEIESEDLGLLEHSGGGVIAVKPLKTLTRKSIKPTRLFQTVEQKRAREAEKEEEAVTDIEDEANSEVAEPILPSTPSKHVRGDTPVSPPLTGRALRSTSKKDAVDVIAANAAALERTKVKKPKNPSPFDSWKRVKAGASSVPVEPTKISKKRGASDLAEDDGAAVPKKAKV